MVKTSREFKYIFDLEFLGERLALTKGKTEERDYRAPEGPANQNKSISFNEQRKINLTDKAGRMRELMEIFDEIYKLRDGGR